MINSPKSKNRYWLKNDFSLKTSISEHRLFTLLTNIIVLNFVIKVSLFPSSITNEIPNTSGFLISYFLLFGKVYWLLSSLQVLRIMR